MTKKTRRKMDAWRPTAPIPYQEMCENRLNVNNANVRYNDTIYTAMRRPTLRPTWPVARTYMSFDSLAKFTGTALSERAPTRNRISTGWG